MLDWSLEPRSEPTRDVHKKKYMCNHGLRQWRAYRLKLRMAEAANHGLIDSESILKTSMLTDETGVEALSKRLARRRTA